MNRVLYCLTNQHDWPFVLMAAVVCVVGLATALVLLGMARDAGPRGRRLYAPAVAVVAGLAIWATHFVAMLGYRAGPAIDYGAPQTLASLAIILAGLSMTVLILMGEDSVWRRLLAALTASSSVAAMHFVGLSAITMEGARIVMEPVLAMGSIFVGLAIAALGALAGRKLRVWRLPVLTCLATCSVVALHFGSMAAIDVVPDPAAMAVGGLSEALLLVVLAVGVSIIVMVAAFVTGVAYWSRTNALSQLREAIDAMPDGLGFYDVNDRLLIWNARYAEVNPEVASSLKVGLLFSDIVRIGLAKGAYTEAAGCEEAWLAERLQARKSLSNTLEQKLAGDRWLRVQDRKTAAGGTVTVCNDITDLKRDAIDLAQARDAAEAANHAKSEFLANMSHEIRTPLNGVIGLAQALDRTELTPDQREMLDLIQSSGRTLQTLLSDILDLARVESGRMEMVSEVFDLPRAIREAGHLYAAAAGDKGLQFFVDIDPEAAVWVQGDSVRLKQVLTNLVSNAVKFTSQGFVSLTASRSVCADGSAIMRFTVEDTGIGFDPEARDRLFTRFEQADGAITRRFGGTGLGLAICRELVGMMGGDLDCESEPGGGSAFIMTLPLKEAAAPASVAEAAPSDDDHDPRDHVRVLLADDHPTNRRVVELILAQAPVVLTCVEDGAQALSAYQAADFDLVFMDMQMPVMDGLTATREIRLHEQLMGLDRTPIVMLTANALPDHVTAGQVAGADMHLAKPFNAAELLALVGDLTSRQKALAA